MFFLKQFKIAYISQSRKCLEFIQDYTYLGVIMNTNMCPDLDIQQMKATYAGGNTLISRFRKCVILLILIKLLKSFCNSLYCSMIDVDWYFNDSNVC